MGFREHRMGQNEARFRRVNERLEELQLGKGSPDGGTLELVCECDARGCMRRVFLTVAEYESVRSDPRRFLVVHGHEDERAEDVVERFERYAVVRKRGEAAEVADATNPRE